MSEPWMFDYDPQSKAVLLGKRGVPKEYPIEDNEEIIGMYGKKEDDWLTSFGFVLRSPAPLVAVPIDSDKQ